MHKKIILFVTVFFNLSIYCMNNQQLSKKERLEKLNQVKQTNEHALDAAIALSEVLLKKRKECLNQGRMADARELNMFSLINASLGLFSFVTASIAINEEEAKITND